MHLKFYFFSVKTEFLGSLISPVSSKDYFFFLSVSLLCTRSFLQANRK